MACSKHPNRREWQENTGVCPECAAAYGSERFNKQSGKCAICTVSLGERNANGDAPPCAQLDHDHNTGQLRGVLCRRCNMALGLFDDSLIRIKAAAEYLTIWKNKASY